MFNGHIAERRKALTRQTQQTKRKEAHIIKKYHTEVQPLLLQNYQKRLRSFINKMEQKPVIINPQNLQPPCTIEPHFTFKSIEDWKSIYPSRQRQQKQKHNKVMRKLKTVGAEQQSPQRSPRIYQFRIRQKAKEIHAPMRYGNELKTSLQNYTRIRTSQIKKSASGKSKIENKSLTKKQQNDSKLVSPGETQRGGGIRDTTISISNSSKNDNDETQFNSKEKTQFAYREKTDNIEIEAKIYEKLRQPDEKKLHFKKIADMALASNDNNEKRQLNEILRKSGFSKMKKSIKIDEKEADFFSMLIQKMGNKQKLLL